MIEARVIEDSVAVNGKRLITLQLCYPRFIHSEFMTHRVFSRNASSSRAIPVAKMIEQVRTNPAMPIQWGLNKPGMQAGDKLELRDESFCRQVWWEAAQRAADFADAMQARGLHKQVANRILEPFQHIHVVVTATEWDNFFALRLHPAAQPEIQELARVMKDAINASWPALRPCSLGKGDWNFSHHNWHLPYVSNTERSKHPVEVLLKMSTARCARVSYIKHDGLKSSVDEDIALHKQLVGSEPKHASPCEHQATPLAYNEGDQSCRNFSGWLQYRSVLENK